MPTHNYYYKIDKKGEPVAGSLQKRSRKPLDGKWGILFKSQILDACCATDPGENDGDPTTPAVQYGDFVNAAVNGFEVTSVNIMSTSNTILETINLTLSGAGGTIAAQHEIATPYVQIASLNFNILAAIPSAADLQVVAVTGGEVAYDTTVNYTAGTHVLNVPIVPVEGYPVLVAFK